MNGEPPYTTQEVFDWEAGWDSAVEGPNTLNCHFSHFRSERSTKAWEAGHDAGKAGKPKPDFDPRDSVGGRTK
ncbi:MAG: hypothetical protein Q8P46_11985 [Hyphomicrobiales bacterium]|nr:hypothetical protein [Hyphomicrobiales bacterium]